MKYSLELKKFEQELKETLSKIPEENRTEPAVQVAMSALSDAQYCVEEPELREMFCKLIASASDSSKAAKTHPSFASIIRRMSPKDAVLLRQLTKRGIYPVANYMLKLSTGGSNLQARNAIIIDGTVLNNINETAASLDVLQSLGLISIDYNKHLTDESQYAPFKECDYYNMLSQIVKNTPESKRSVDIEKGCLSLTGLGMQFVTVCM